MPDEYYIINIKEEQILGAYISFDRAEAVAKGVAILLEKKIGVLHLLKEFEPTPTSTGRYSWICDVCGKDNPITNTVCSSTCREEVRKL